MSTHPLLPSLDRPAAETLLAEIVAILRVAPLYQPTMPRTGKPLSVLMTNCGPLGWVTDKDRGYRYQPTHPQTQEPWPPIPQTLLDLWARHAPYSHLPEACLINYYAEGTRMGLHQDRDEADFDAPVLSVSLGDTARFRLGTTTRSGPTDAFLLRSGDVMMLAGPNRLAFHGVDKVLLGSSNLLLAYPDLFPGGGRINLTMRRVNKAAIDRARAIFPNPRHATTRPAMLTPGAVLLHDTLDPAGENLLFSAPRDIVIAHNAEEAITALARLETAQAQGLHAAGYLAYELGFLFRNA